MKRLFALALVVALGVGTARAQQPDYIVGSQDVLTITVYDQADLSGKFKVEADGTSRFRWSAASRRPASTCAHIENDLKKQLADGYLKNPQVTRRGRDVPEPAHLRPRRSAAPGTVSAHGRHDGHRGAGTRRIDDHRRAPTKC